MKYSKPVEGLSLEELREEYNHLKTILDRVYDLMSDPILIPDEHNFKNLRPVKGTTRHEVYDKLLKVQYVLGIPHGWIPKEWD